MPKASAISRIVSPHRCSVATSAHVHSQPINDGLAAANAIEANNVGMLRLDCLGHPIVSEVKDPRFSTRLTDGPELDQLTKRTANGIRVGGHPRSPSKGATHVPRPQKLGGPSSFPLGTGIQEFRSSTRRARGRKGLAVKGSESRFPRNPPAAPLRGCENAGEFAGAVSVLRSQVRDPGIRRQSSARHGPEG